MLRSFVEIVDKPKDEEAKSRFDRLIKQMSKGNFDNVLGSFASEFAEARANLNKEQAFYYLALYQYSVSRKQMFDIYASAMKEQHQDVRRSRAISQIKNGFADFTTPCYPKIFSESVRELESESRPLQILQDCFSIEQLKEGLPSMSGYLILQISSD